MQKQKGRFSNGARRRKLQEKYRHSQEPCHLCGRPIDYSLPHILKLPDGSSVVHPASFVIDEIIPVKYGGSAIQATNTAPAHAACNSVRGAKSLQWCYGPGRSDIMKALPEALQKTQNKINKSSRNAASKQQHDAQSNAMSNTW